MSNSHRKQTRAVGTVEYMAPEVSNGSYTKSIDIYACGVIFYEMLVGHSPFRGETDAEILMKHLTAEPDIQAVPERFREVVAKSLEKTPSRRYESLNEMLRAVDAALPAAAPLQLPSPPPPPALPVATPVPRVPAARLPAPLPIAKPVVQSPVVPIWDRLGDLSGAMAKAPLYAAMIVLPWAALGGHLDDWPLLGKGFLLALAIAWAAIIGMGRTLVEPADRWGKRFLMAGFGLLIGVLAFWLDGWPMPIPGSSEESAAMESYLFDLVRMSPAAVPILGQYLLYYGAAVGLIGWWNVAARNRSERFSLFPLITAGLWGGGLLFLWPTHDQRSTIQFGIVPLVVASAVVQLVSPWSPPPPPMPRRLRWRG